MTDELNAVIYRFVNATVVDWPGRYAPSDVTLYSHGEPVEKLAVLEADDKRNGGGQEFYVRTFGKLELARSSWTQEIANYVPRDSTSKLRELDEDSYEKLSPNFKRLYEKRLAEPVETRTPVAFELKLIDSELNRDVLFGKEFISPLHELIFPLRKRIADSARPSWGSSDKEARADFARALPLALTANEIKHLIVDLGARVSRSNKFQAIAGWPGWRSEGDIEVTFYSKPYRGEMRKVLDKKSNGQPYADGRGRMVRDLAPTAGSAIVTQENVWAWWEFIGGPELSDEEKLQAINEFVDTLWCVEG